MQSTALQQAGRVGSRVAGSRRAPCRAPARPQQRHVIARGVKFSDEFMSVLTQALEREEQRIAQKVGIPGLVIHEDVDVEGNDSTGQVIWSAGVQLAAHLNKNRRDLLRGARVLEIGCGTGIVGLTCACLGARVLLTDVRDVIPSTWDNVRANADLIEEAGGAATVAELDWSVPNDDVLSQDFDWIIGSDVTYEEGAFAPLARLLRQMVLTNPNAITKVAHRHRSKELDRTMREVFAAEGLVLRPVDVKTTGSTEWEDPIHVDEAIIFYRVMLDPSLQPPPVLGDVSGNGLSDDPNDPTNQLLAAAAARLAEHNTTGQ